MASENLAFWKETQKYRKSEVFYFIFLNIVIPSGIEKQTKKKKLQQEARKDQADRIWTVFLDPNDNNCTFLVTHTEREAVEEQR